MSKTVTSIDFPEHPGRGRHSKEHKQKRKKFANQLKQVDSTLDFKMSARGWGYYLEGEGVIDKGELDRVANMINDFREDGTLPLNFTAKDESRMFRHTGGLTDAPEVDDYIQNKLHGLKNGYGYNPAFWETQDYYLMLVVEKVDMATLFSDQCRRYNIPVANAKGWSSMNQRGELMSRCYQAAANRRQYPVILYCGDFDPAGVYISDNLRSNMEDLAEAAIPDGEGGYVTNFNLDPVTIDRFALNKETIDDLGLTWINNLKTGSGKDMAKSSHSSYEKYNVPEWLDTIGERKVEANALLKETQAAKDLFQETIEKYLGDDPFEEYRDERSEMKKGLNTRISSLGLSEPIEQAIDEIEGNDDDNDDTDLCVNSSDDDDDDDYRANSAAEANW